MLPREATAGVLSSLFSSLRPQLSKDVEAAEKKGENLQSMPLLQPAMNIDPTAARGGGDITIVDDSALLPAEGPSGTMADIVKPKAGIVSTHVVKGGDTLSQIAELFDVSPNTIIWANDLPRGKALKEGQRLTILPITGVRYTVKKGDTLSSIAKRYGADADEIRDYNGIDSSGLSVGTELIIPDGVIAAAPSRSGGSRGTYASPAQVGFYLRPVSGGQRTQGIHGYNGIDIAAPIGTPVVASASGHVVVAKQNGWNGGYGSYVVIEHSNGSQTLYAHASSVAVYQGQHVGQGQVIAYVGNSGKSTGSHLHFEIRNGIRNPF